MTADPRFRGWWPREHPLMRSFLGVPMLVRGEVLGAIYLTDKEGAIAFSEDDERRIVLLAAHAALAIDNARLHERSRELTIAEERNRLARELHDSVVQQLFGVTLAAESAGALLERDPAAAGAQLARAQELARGAIEELRSVVAALRPASVEAEGLAGALRKHVEVLRRVTGREIALRDAGVAGPPGWTTTPPPRSSGSRRRRCRTRCATRARSGSRCGWRAARRSCSPWPTTAAASTRARRRCARSGSG